MDDKATARRQPGDSVTEDEFEELYGVALPFSTKEGVMVNSGEYTGMSVADGQKKLADWMEAEGIGERKVNYRMRDWLISRQRYWGCPIPIVHDSAGGMHAVPDDQLPVELPDIGSYEPAQDGSSPLAHIPEFVNVTGPDGQPGRRETDTMGGFACSSWYFLRFCDPHNDGVGWDPEEAEYWMPVDCYVGGAEHAVMHLLYARFWTKVLYDAGYVKFQEPFTRLMNQGQVLGRTPYRRPKEGEALDVGEHGVLLSYEEAEKTPDEEVEWRWVRMSKSKGNVVTPEEAVEGYGADALRIYELFVAPFEADVQWSNEGMQGAVRFLGRVFKLASECEQLYDKEWRKRIDMVPADGVSAEIRRSTHKTVAKATKDIEAFAFNTYISAMMSHLNDVNDLLKKAAKPNEAERLAVSEMLEHTVLVLAPAAPHTADEIWRSLGCQGFTFDAAWPEADESLTVEDTVTVAVQVQGKLRDTIELPADATEEQMEEAALASKKVQKHLVGKTVRKVIVVPGRLVNIVAS
ncbi:MAG: class I tRNA ligase family protein [Armatimonadetes bacterium]|nr:class I tRNA ligase family protein [Armatimonadota bacterium]